VAITIRNKTTEELIRTIGQRTGEGPSAVIRRLAETENRMLPGEQSSQEEIAQRLRLMRDLREKYRNPNSINLSWQEIEREMDSIFGDDLNSPPRSH